jgi:hypothetical protein
VQFLDALDLVAAKKGQSLAAIVAQVAEAEVSFDFDWLQFACAAFCNAGCTHNAAAACW